MKIEDQFRKCLSPTGTIIFGPVGRRETLKETHQILVVH